MPSSAIELLTQLTFVGKIPSGSKVNVRNSTLIEAESNFGSVLRYMTGESRDNTITYIRNTITKAIEIIPTSDPITQSSLVDSLRHAVEGINNLTETYKDDVYYVSKLETEVKRIDHFIKWMSEQNHHVHH